MIRTISTVVFAGALALAGIAHAQKAAPDADDAKAKATLEKMAKLIAGAKSLSVTLDNAYDVVQPEGQKIEFGETRKVGLRRPDRFRVDTEERDGSRRGLLMDGKTISMFDLDENVYASVEKTGAVDAQLEHAVDELGMRIPLKELFESDLPKTIASAESVSFVDRENLGGVQVDHIAVRGPEVDYEVWVATGERPLPQRIVITYRQEEGQPQFAATFLNWNLAADLPDAIFTYTPDPAAERIRVAPMLEGAKR